MREGAGTGNFRNREKCHHLIKSQQWSSFNVGKFSTNLTSQHPEAHRPFLDDYIIQSPSFKNMYFY